MNPLVQYIGRPTSQPISNEGWTIQMQKLNVKSAREGQRFKLSGRLIFPHVTGQIVPGRMQDRVTSGFLFWRRPIITFILIAFVAGIHQILKVVGSPSGARAIVCSDPLKLDRF